MSDRPRNAFLRSLGQAAYDLLTPSLKLIDLNLTDHVLHQGAQALWVVFPESGLLSLISLNRRGLSLETSMAGNEGAAGLLEACGSGQSSVDCVVQVDGRGWRSPAVECRKLSLTNADFQAKAWKLIELQMNESRQSGVCQATHTVEQRFARWLLESFDRSGGRNPLPFTQEFLAAMLGVQRTTVSAYAAELQREGLIAYVRGRLQLLDMEGLERRTCDCRNIAKAQRARLQLESPPTITGNPSS